MRFIVINALLGTLFATVAQAAPGPVLDPDPVLRAMTNELERSQDDLLLEGHLRPYFVALTVKEDDYQGMSGKMGALFTRERSLRRMGRADVRVGEYALDSSEDLQDDWLEPSPHSPDTMLPTEDAPEAIEHGLWLLTDQAYKQALAAHLRVKGQTVFRAKDRERPSFSPAPPVEVTDPRTPLQFDHVRWAEDVRSLGRYLATVPRIEDHAIHVDATRVTRWLVNSEGTRLRTEQQLFAVTVSAWTRTSDGVLLNHSVNRYGPTEGSLPSPDALLDATASMVEELLKLADAPVLEPYTGPAILTSRAAGVFFHEVLGHRLEGHRQDQEDEGQTFSDHLDRVILPTFLSVVDDPTVRAVADTPLNGAYTYDDEGVASQRVTLVDRGRLKGFLMGRRPVKGFSSSNGHGRAEGLSDPVARMGNLLVSSSEAVSEARLKAMLLAELRRQDLPFGIIVRDLWGGSTNTSSYGYQAFKGEARVVARVDAKTGEETLVRGVDIVGTPLTSLGQILAVGDHLEVFNGYCGAESGMVPVSSVAPAILIRSLELQRSVTERSRAPVLDAPHRARSPSP